MTITAPRLVVAALRGGCGKTTISLGLISAWRKLGRHVIPFKKGPDYIDAGWLAQAAGTNCYNLDPYLMAGSAMLTSFAHRTCGEDILAVVEGNRGLFDGADTAGTCSTAELAKHIKAPTVLLVDTTKATRTLAAVVYGCRMFDPELNLAGVILNQVATSRQEKLVRTVIESDAGVPVLGAVPRVRDHDLPERHLGLVPHQEHPAARKALDLLSRLVGDNVDLPALEQVARDAAPLDCPGGEELWQDLPPSRSERIRVGIIRDSAFQFYYPENLEALERLGAEIVVFSSLDTHRLPELDALYLGGGFPETHAEVLANNQGLRDEIRRAAEAGMPIYAECGGLMFLGRELCLESGTYPMAGVFPVSFTLEERPQGHGYTRVIADRENPFFSNDTLLVGHEFHYSRPVDYDPDRVRLVFKVERGHGFADGRDGLCYKNVLAGYTHLHALGSTKWAEALLELAAQYGRDRCSISEGVCQ